MPGDAAPDTDELFALFTCRALIESCLLVEEGVCSVRDIDLGMMAGAGLDPRRGLLPPFCGPEGLRGSITGPRGLSDHPAFRLPPSFRGDSTTGTSNVMPKAMNMVSTKERYLSMSVIICTPAGA